MSKKFYEEGEIKIVRATKEGARGYQIIKIGTKRFKLVANMSSATPCGFDHDMCTKVILDNGDIKSIFDAKSIGGFSNGRYCRDKESAKEQVYENFALMRKHLKELFL